jgi:hypothetical protein
MLLGSTVVLSRRFDPERVLGRGRAPPADRAGRRPGDARGAAGGVGVVRHVVAAGHREQRQRLPGDLVQRVHRPVRAGAAQPLRLDEVAYAAVAVPDDLAADPRTAGRRRGA